MLACNRGRCLREHIKHGVWIIVNYRFSLRPPQDILSVKVFEYCDTQSSFVCWQVTELAFDTSSSAVRVAVFQVRDKDIDVHIFVYRQVGKIIEKCVGL